MSDLSRSIRRCLRLGLTLPLLTLVPPADAAEGFRLRQTPIGVFTGDNVAGEKPGFLGTASLTYARLNKVADDDGNDLAIAARSVPLPTAAPTGGAVPNGTYTLAIPAGAIAFTQSQTQVNLLGGYVTDTDVSGGRIAVAVVVPLIRMSRRFAVTLPPTSIVPTPAATLPAALRGAISAVAAAANTQVQATLNDLIASQNAEVSGVGDTELSAAWVRRVDRLKVIAGMSLFIPTGAYDKARGPNPGFGDFYTLRSSAAVTYALGPDAGSGSADAGVTLMGRVAYGVNTRNKDTDYRSGNFAYFEGGIAKTLSRWTIGANLLAIRQLTDDSGAGVPVGSNPRYRNNSAGIFATYPLPNHDDSFSLHYTHNFGSRNAQVARALQLRYVRAW